MPAYNPHGAITGSLTPDEQAIPLTEPEPKVRILLDQPHRLVSRIDFQYPEPTPVPLARRRAQTSGDHDLVLIRGQVVERRIRRGA